MKATRHKDKFKSLWDDHGVELTTKPKNLTLQASRLVQFPLLENANLVHQIDDTVIDCTVKLETLLEDL